MKNPLMGQKATTDSKFMRQLDTLPRYGCDKIFKALPMLTRHTQECVAYLLRRNGMRLPVFDPLGDRFRRILSLKFGKCRKHQITTSDIARVYNGDPTKGIFTTDKHCAFNCRQRQTTRRLGDVSPNQP